MTGLNGFFILNFLNQLELVVILVFCLSYKWSWDNGIFKERIF